MQIVKYSRGDQLVVSPSFVSMAPDFLDADGLRLRAHFGALFDGQQHLSPLAANFRIAAGTVGRGDGCLVIQARIAISSVAGIRT
jgi:hypothetical protein